MKSQYFTLIAILIIVIIIGVMFGGVFSLYTSAEGFESDEKMSPENSPIQKLITEDVSQNRKIEELREVLKQTVKEVDELEKHRKTRDAKDTLDDKQNRHIEELREVLSNTIRQLRKDDILPAGSSCDCNAKPVINPETGMAEPADACRPPGWLRLMERENKKNDPDANCK